jgi:hypothetical protein
MLAFIYLQAYNCKHTNTKGVLMDKQQPKKAIGGHARAKALSSEERSVIARKAATARWNSDLPQAEYEGSFFIGDTQVNCAVLPNAQRIITQGTFLKLLGRSRSPKGGTGVFSTVDGLPIFLQNEALTPYITEELAMSTTPVFYTGKNGGKGVGYDARIVPKVADVYLKLRDAALRSGNPVPKRYEKTVIAADILVRGLADQGIISMVDDATGYQRDRAKDAVVKILEQFVAKAIQPWMHTFPDEFYEELFRLRGLHYPTVKKPQYIGHLTNDIIYARLAPSVLEELKNNTPRDAKGRHAQQLHRRLTPDIGHPKLRELLASVITLMKLSNNYDEFHDLLERIHPKYGNTLPMPLHDKPKMLN